MKTSSHLSLFSRPPRMLAILALAGLPLWACAGWVKIGETETLAIYQDQSTVKKEEAVYKVWELQDLKVTDPEGVRSRRYINEYDCQNRMHRIGNMVSFSGPMLTGKKLFDVDEMGYWRKIPNAGLFAVGFVIHCSR